MITLKDFYTVMTAVVPLYVAMILAYGSVRWWKLLTPAQCSGINRFVAIFAVPLLSFHIISHNNPYEINHRFVVADVLQKIIVLVVLGLWARFRRSSKTSSLDWTITLFMISTLPNTLVLGIPLEVAMYGAKPGNLVVQAVVLQCIVWYTLLLFLFEYRSARNLILEQFPGPVAANIASFRIDPDVVSLDGTEPIKTEAEIGQDGKIHVQVKRSPPPTSSMFKEMDSSISLLRSPGFVSSLASSKVGTPRASDLTGVEIYSLQSSRNMTPSGTSSRNDENQDLCLTVSAAGTRNSSPYHNNHRPSNGLAIDTSTTTISSNDMPQSSNHSSNIHTPREPVIPPTEGRNSAGIPMYPPRNYYSPSPRGSARPEHLDFQRAARSPLERLFVRNEVFSPMKLAEAAKKMDYQYDTRDMQMFVWSSSTSPASEKGGNSSSYETRRLTSSNPHHLSIEGNQACPDCFTCFGCFMFFFAVPSDSTPLHPCMQQNFSFVDNVLFQQGDTPLSEKSGQGLKIKLESPRPSTIPFTPPKVVDEKQSTQMPPPAVMSSLIFRMMWRKLIRNPNTYASLLGLAWALVAYRWNVGMPKLLERSITILSDAGLGMAMFSLGLFMALQSRILACGTTMAIVVMIVRFITGPAIMSTTSIAVGLRNVELRASIIQAALPQGIVPFVFAKEYDVHPDVLSTAVIFGMLISLPIDLLYYVLLGL